MIDMCNANFLAEFFFQEIPDTNILIGSYPIELYDMNELSEAGCTGILSLLTPFEVMQRGISKQTMSELCYQNSIDYQVNVPIDDYDEIEYVVSLFKAAC